MSIDTDTSAMTNTTDPRTSPATRPRLFGIDGGAPFFEGTAPDRTWNGWAVPRFTHPVTRAIVAHLNHGDPPETPTAWWEPRRTLCLRENDDIVRVTPHRDGTYTFDGWCWLAHHHDDHDDRDDDARHDHVWW